MSWLDDQKTVNKKLTPIRPVSGTRVVRLDIGKGYSVAAIPQDLAIENVWCTRFMPQVSPPYGGDIMLVENMCNDVESALKTAIMYRRMMILEELSELESAFFD